MTGRRSNWRSGCSASSLDDVLPVTLNTHTGAVSLAREHGLPFFDVLIVAAAIEAGCDTLFSEDMQHGRSIGGLAIVNPFLDRAG